MLQNHGSNDVYKLLCIKNRNSLLACNEFYQSMSCVYQWHSQLKLISALLLWNHRNDAEQLNPLQLKARDGCFDSSFFYINTRWKDGNITCQCRSSTNDLQFHDGKYFLDWDEAKYIHLLKFVRKLCLLHLS